MKSPFSKATILIVTRNRSQLLHDCLFSLSTQKIFPKEICIIDNNSTDNTKRVVGAFTKVLPISYHKTGAKGYPNIYNAGLSISSGKSIIFFDDDCVASSDWAITLNNMMCKYPTAIIQGKIISTPKENIYANVMGMHYHNWLISNMISQHKLRTFDNKNLCVPIEFFKKYGYFDTDLHEGSEDLELGARLFRNGVTILYCPEVVAFHQERTTLYSFISQHIRIARSEAIVDQKLHPNETTKSVYLNKVKLHILGAIDLGITYLKDGKFINIVKLCNIYILLAVIRIWTYHITVWQIRK